MSQDWNDPGIQASIVQDALESAEKIAGLEAENARYRTALEQIKAVRYGLDSNANDEERADYWSHLAKSYREMARKALRGPQDA